MRLVGIPQETAAVAVVVFLAAGFFLSHFVLNILDGRVEFLNIADAVLYLSENREVLILFVGVFQGCYQLLDIPYLVIHAGIQVIALFFK